MDQGTLTTTEFWDLIKKARQGEKILVATVAQCDDWRPYHQGVVTRLGNKYFANGGDDAEAAGGWWKEQSPARIRFADGCNAQLDAGVFSATLSGYQISIDGEAVHLGLWESVMVHPYGLMLKKGNEFWLIVVAALKKS